MPGAEILPFKPHPVHPHGALTDPPHDTSPVIAELQMLARLHRQLDLHTLLEEFLRELQAELPVEGLSFTVPGTGETFLVGQGGRLAQHSRLQFGGEYLGEIELYARFDTREVLRDALALLAAPLHNALAHHQLRMLARKDSLTGLGNRLALDTALATELARAQRFGQPFAVLVVDIDHFKQVNDSFGHSAGDQVLRTVAHQITECLRTYDQAFRFGGEEFVVLLSQTARAKAMEIAERIRRRIAVRCKASATPAQKITVSIGCGEYRSHESLAELFDRADRALYSAKRQGRNRVVAAS